MPEAVKLQFHLKQNITNHIWILTIIASLVYNSILL